MLDENVKTFVMNVKSLNLNSMAIYFAKKAKIALLIAKKVKIPIKYLNFLDVFLKKRVLILSEATKLN